MPTSTLTQYPLTLSLDSFHPSSRSKIEPYTDLSLASLYSPLDVDEFGTDFTTDSAGSPASPLSPAISTFYALPQEGDWIAWDKMEHSPERDYFKSEPYEDSILPSVPLRNLSVSPAINPMALTNPHFDDVLFGREGIHSTQPLFTPAAVAAKKPSQPTQLPSKRYPRGNNNLKRKSNAEEDDDEQLSQRSSASPPPRTRRTSKDSDAGAGAAGPKKTAHNMIEKRYRNNLNDKIAALRDAVPALRVTAHRAEAGGSEGDEEDGDVAGAENLDGLTPAHKLNKATILGKATEYIVHLERRNQLLAKENAALRGRVEGFEMLVMSRGAANGMWA